MTAVWVALIVAGASTIVLAVFVASGLAPLRSLRTSVARMDELRAEAERLRRNVDVLERRRRDLGRAHRPT